MGAPRIVVAVVALCAMAQAARHHQAGVATANPIRKVVTMLQKMQAKVVEEGDQEKKLHDKFVCYCQENDGALTSSIKAAEARVPALGSSIEKDDEQKKQLDEEVKKAQTDRSAAESTMSEAVSIREKEAAAFATEKADKSSNIEAITRAVAALEKGMAGSFLQTGTAQVLQKLVATTQDIIEEDREVLLSFLDSAHSSGYVPHSSEVTGILKQMGDEMRKDLAQASAVEEAAIEEHTAMMVAQKKEVAALTTSIETKMKRSGDLAVTIMQMKNDLSDTEEALISDKKYLSELERGCSTQAAAWEERSKTRSAELTALAETIKILTDDEALDLFKKALPSAASSFVQVLASAAALRGQALESLRGARRTGRSGHPGLDLVALALRGRKVGFEKVVAMIDGMVETLKKEQLDDDSKKEYCSTQLDLTEDKQKSIERLLADRESAIENFDDGLATLAEEISALKAGIKALDKSVTEATAQRKQEHEEFKELMASDSAAKELLNFAKSKLNKFYNPSLALTQSQSTLAQVSSHAQLRGAPPPPPETFGAYAAKSEESAGVLAMMDTLIRDLEKEMVEAATEEKNAQADYEELLQDSAEKRRADSRSLTQKEDTEAEMKTDLEEGKDAKATAEKELAATLKFTHLLHTECDWLLQYFTMRKEARADEIDGLGKAKAVLSGADFSLLQMGRHGVLRRSG